MGTRELIRVRKIVLALPGVNERLSHGEPCFFVRDHRPLYYYHDDHNSDGRISLWRPAPLGVQEELVAAEADPQAPDRIASWSHCLTEPKPWPRLGGSDRRWWHYFLADSYHPAPPLTWHHASPEDRFFNPPTSARGTFSNWLGVFLDAPDENGVDWEEIAAILEDAFRNVAPKALIAELDKR